LASDGKWYPPDTWTGPPAGAPPMANPYTAGPQYTQYPQYQYQQYPQYGMPDLGQQTKTNGLAIASLVCSCVGLFFFGIAAIVGIVFGFVARAQIAKSDGRQKGGGLALAGIIVGFGMLALGIILIIVIVNSHSFHSCFSTSTQPNCGNS
jgi:hypothetical protein